MKEIIDKVKITAARSLTRHVISAIESANLKIEAQATMFTNTQLPPLREESDAIAERFMSNLHEYFDALTTLETKSSDVTDYGGLSLVDHDSLEAIIAMEGMVNYARNYDIQQYISFTTRIGILFPNLRIDETNNPLDPEQIGDCFSEAIRPMELKAHYLLTIYREFNKEVFHNLAAVLAEANEVLIDSSVIPKLDIKARDRALQKSQRAANRPTTDVSTRAFEKRRKEEGKKPEKANPEMFAMMQTLVKGLAEKQGAHSELLVSSTIPDGGSLDAGSGSEVAIIKAQQQDLKEQQAQLMDMLGTIQATLISQQKAGTIDTSPDSGSISESINKSIGEGSKKGERGVIDGQSSDVINLVSLLYEAIRKDDTLPAVMKELIGRTQISTMKLALADTSFFENRQHPGRVILDEFEMAGIAWTEMELLEDDPIYSKVKELVERYVAEDEVNDAFLQGLIDELRTTKSENNRVDAALERRIRETIDHSERLDDVKEFVSQKINERVLKEELDPFIRSLLKTHVHDFFVKLVLKEGPGGSSWKPVISTIDVLLWTVQSDKQPGDRERFDKVNPRLLDNLEKAFEIGGTSKTKIKQLMGQLKQVQEYSFHESSIATDGLQPQTAPSDVNEEPESRSAQPRTEPPPLARNDPHLRQVNKLPIGVWLEFKEIAGHPIRCTLAAKIDSIDKLFFVNLQGVKVVEVTRMGLARELKAGLVKIVSEGSLIDRAMESVISNLREPASKVDAGDASPDLATT